MSEPGKDRWNSLLETLGVPADETAPPPTTSEPSASESATTESRVKQPVSMLRPEKKAAAKAKPTKPPAKSPSYWSRIAGALGLESAAEAEPTPEASIEQPVVEAESTESVAESILPPDHFAPRRSEEPRPREREEFSPREGGRRSSRRDERPTRGEERQPRGEDRPPRSEERPPRSEERPPRREERSRREERDVPSPPIVPPALNEMFGSKPADINVFGLGLDHDDSDDEESDQPRARSVKEQPLDDHETGPVLDYDQPEGSDLSFGEPRSGQPESGNEEGESRDGHRRRRRRRGRGRGRGTEQPQQSAPLDEVDIEPAREDADFDFDRDEELELDADVRDQPAPGRERSERPERGPQRNRDSASPGYSRGAERQPRHGNRGDSGRGEGVRGETGRGENVRSEGVRGESVRGEGGRGEGGRGASRDDDSRGSRSRRERPERGERAPPPAGQTGYPRGDERGERRPPRDQRPPTGRGARPVDDELDDDLHAVDIEDDEVGESGLPTHSKIPTWDEAVNLLIDANMATRASNPDRGGGGDRGRGRGGRGRGR